VALSPSVPLPPPAPPPSLEREVITARQTPARRRQGRAFHRIMSGLNRSGRNFRFLTLTTRAGVRDSTREFQEDWRKLKERLRRRGIMPHYIRVVEFTKSGLPHAHILTAGGGYLPQWWISKVWEEVHGAKVVDIRFITRRQGDGFWQGHKSMAGYLAKYMSKDSVARLAYSPGWAWQGLARSWGAFRAGCAYLGIPWGGQMALWRSHCEVGVDPTLAGALWWESRLNPGLQRILWPPSPSRRGHRWGATCHTLTNTTRQPIKLL